METIILYAVVNAGAIVFGGAINAVLLKLHRKKTKKSFDELLSQLDQRQIERNQNEHEREPDHIERSFNAVETPSENGYKKPVMNSKFKQ